MLLFKGHARLEKMFRYRYFAYTATVLTGFASLCAQVVWQKYLAILVGSEAKSLSLVVAVFLFGLASGYYVFGRMTEQKWSRWLLLKIYGYIEVFTAVYISVFYLYFYVLKALSFSLPAFLIFDILVSLLALILPTFLMGASIPLLTATLPESSKEISQTHARIYGWNTIGAFLGTLASGFYLVPKFGLESTLVIAGAVNLLAGFIFVGNKLEGDTHKQEKIPHFPTRLSNTFYMAFIFFTGAIVIAFEILLVRVLNLSIGSGVYNFPIILSVFIGGLALGSLSIKDSKISIVFFMRQILFTLILISGLYISAPYWGIWINHMRVSLVTLDSSYYIFKFFIYLFVFVFLFPPVFFMGRLLPLTYSLIKKTDKDYGLLCGRLYFFNTLGTVFGTIFMGYLLLYFLNLDHIFKLGLILLAIFGLAIAYYEKRFVFLSFFVVLSLTSVFLPGWDRTGHYLSYFRNRNFRQTDHFKKLFFLPKRNVKGKIVRFFKDGPNTTVTILENSMNSSGFELQAPLVKSLFQIPVDRPYGYSVIVNGKSDGHNLSDFSTMFWLAGLGYLFGPEQNGLKSAVIGLGTGVTVGILAQSKEVKEVDVIEISSQVIKGLKKAPPTGNFHVMTHPKVRIIEKDAFKYFTKSKKKFDIIVSEPSNPWVVGIENLYTKEFYELSKKSLSSEGVLVQWIHEYSLNSYILQMIIKTISGVFPHVAFYDVGRGDAAFVASAFPLKSSPLPRRFFEEPFFRFSKSLGFYKPRDIFLYQTFSESQMRYIAQSLNQFASGRFVPDHTLTNPRLTYEADKAFFMGHYVSLPNIVPRYVFSSGVNDRSREILRFVNLSDREVSDRCWKGHRNFPYFCQKLSTALKLYRNYQNPKLAMRDRFQSYLYLKDRRFVDHDPVFMDSVLVGLHHSLSGTKKGGTPAYQILKNPRLMADYIPLMNAYLDFLIAEGEISQARLDYKVLKKASLKRLPNWSYDIDARLKALQTDHKLIDLSE